MGGSFARLKQFTPVAKACCHRIWLSTRNRGRLLAYPDVERGRLFCESEKSQALGDLAP